MAKILIVDDDASLREVIRLSLESAGHEVIEAENGAQGVDYACAKLPDLVLCDVRMEKMDGYSTLLALRQHSATASLPFILMTGQAHHEGMRQGMELGADDYLPKPFNMQQLLAAVEVRLKKQQRIREQAERKLSELRNNISLALPHELLTPLNGILGFSDLMVSEARTMKPDEIVSMAQAIRDSAERLHRLIQNFLVLAHVELHQTDPARFLSDAQVLNVRSVAEKTACQRAEKMGRAADLVFEGSDVFARSKEEYLTKIVEELFDNALKFSVAGTPVRVGVRRESNHAVVRIADRGRGMKAEHIAEVGAYMQFERRFYEQQGSGLGLSICKRLAELHGGSLSISSEVGVGTAVDVRLPACASGG